MNLNGKQIISIIGAVVSVLMISTAQLTDLFGPSLAKTIGSIAGLVNMMISSIMAVLTSQGSMVKEVAAMPGIEPLRVNAMANATLAAIAVDPTQAKVSPTTEARSAVIETAKGT